MECNEESELRLSDPLCAEWPEEKLSKAMNDEMKSMKDYKVYDEVSTDGWSATELKKVIKTRWVLVWKGEDKGQTSGKRVQSGCD